MRSAVPASYSSKTLVGNWYDQRKDPEFEGTRLACLTETQLRNAEGTSWSFRHFPSPYLIILISICSDWENLTGIWRISSFDLRYP